MIQISVKDTGLGIKKEDLSKLFKAFGKVNDQADLLLNSHGVGLGLLISNLLASQINILNKGIEVVSVWGEGSTFSFVISDINEKVAENVSESNHSEIENLDQLDCKLIHTSNNSGYDSDYLLSRNESLPKINSITGNSSIFSEEKVSHNINNKLLQISKDKKKINVNFNPNNLKANYRTISGGTGGRSSFYKLNSFFVTETLSFKELASLDHESDLEKEIDFIKIHADINKCEARCPSVLIIDDNDFNILALRVLIKRIGLSSDSSFSADDGIKRIKDLYELGCCRCYKFIFLDIEMPIKNGFEAYEEMQKYFEEQHLYSNIIALTAHQDGSEIFKRIKEVGIQNALTKPVSLEVLVLTLKKMVVRI